MTTPDIQRLSPAERLALIGQLWDSLESENLPLPPAQAAELDHRLATADADLAQSQPWDELHAELSARAR